MVPTYAPPTPPAERRLTTRGVRAGDRYLVALGVVLTGYALFSRGFAYLGLPPLFIGEIMIGAGLVALARAGRLGPLLGQPAAVLVLALAALAAARTVPYLGVHGLDAVRDFMQVGYAVYAFIVGGLLVARPERLARLVRDYGRFVVALVGVVWLVYLAFKTAEASIPRVPWAGHVRIVEAKGGDIMVHLCAATVFVAMGLRSRPAWLVALLALNVGLIVVSNRGGMVAYVLGVGLAWALRPPQWRAGRLGVALLVLMALGVLAGPVLSIHGGGRQISVEQIVVNARSIFGQGGNHLDGTRTWRLRWWGKIVDYTVFGDYFWAGRGFGVNLAQTDGFDVVKELRSPHNGHLTVLARAGVPGFALWLAMLAAWFGSLFAAWRAARRAGRHRWMALFAFLMAYVLAICINASFDVFLEGPMGGIWFWSLIGTGLAARSLFHTHPSALSDDSAPLGGARPGAPRAAVPWSWSGDGGPPAGAPAGAPRAHPVPAGGR